MCNFLTDTSIIQIVVCLSVTYLIGRFISDYFDYLKTQCPPQVVTLKSDFSSMHSRVNKLERQVVFLINIILKKEHRNGKN